MFKLLSHASGKMYAIKFLCKRRFLRKKSTFMERDMLMKFNSPFVVGLIYTFQTTDMLCIVLDLMCGECFKNILKYYRMTSVSLFLVSIA